MDELRNIDRPALKIHTTKAALGFTYDYNKFI